MNAVDTSTIVPNLIVGPVAILMGILVVKYRVKLRNFFVGTERAIYGKKAVDGLGKLQTPFWVGFAGVGFVLLGCSALSFGVVRLVQLLAG
jgi:hypothetical protein